MKQLESRCAKKEPTNRIVFATYFAQVNQNGNLKTTLFKERSFCHKQVEFRPRPHKQVLTMNVTMKHMLLQTTSPSSITVLISMPFNYILLVLLTV